MRRRLNVLKYHQTPLCNIWGKPAQQNHIIELVTQWKSFFLDLPHLKEKVKNQLKIICILTLLKTRTEVASELGFKIVFWKLFFICFFRRLWSSKQSSKYTITSAFTSHFKNSSMRNFESLLVFYYWFFKNCVHFLTVVF